MIRHLALLLLAVLLRHHACAYGNEGHETTARVAFSLLTPSAAAKVKKILAGMSVASAATWPDDIKPSGKLAGTSAAVAFNKKHRNNRKWHYVDLPLGTAAFPSDHRHAHPSNVVEIIDRCIDVLEGKSKMMTRKQALCWLLHLVGDLHQPLHAGCGYYAAAPGGGVELVKDPQIAKPGEHDGGGNGVDLPGSSNLHSFWDSDMVAAVAQSSGDSLLWILTKTIQQEHFTVPAGTYRDWPKAWAVDSVRAANEAYAGFRLTQGSVTSDGWKLTAAWEVSRQQYVLDRVPLAKRRLGQAAFDIAQLLNAIHWK